MTSRRVRFLTQTALFDGHDVSINIIRRVLLSSGVEVVHLAHNRSVQEIVRAAVQENVDGVAVSSYQGGHVEFFKFLVDELRKNGAGHVKVFGGGGGVISLAEISELQDYGVAKVFSPEDGQTLGLQGMIDAMIHLVGGKRVNVTQLEIPEQISDTLLGRLMSAVSCGVVSSVDLPDHTDSAIPIIGFSGTGGSGKSTAEDEIIRRFLQDNSEIRIATLAIDPSGIFGNYGSLLGDRLRFNCFKTEDYASRLFFHSFSHCGSDETMMVRMNVATRICKKAGFDLIIVETPGIGQINTSITSVADFSVYMMTPEYGAPSQLEKIGMLAKADIVVLNKFEKQGGEDALLQVKKVVQGFGKSGSVYPSVASSYDDPGISSVYLRILEFLSHRSTEFSSTSKFYSKGTLSQSSRTASSIVPPSRVNYLGEVANAVRKYHKWAEEQAGKAFEWQSLEASRKLFSYDPDFEKKVADSVGSKWSELDETVREWLSKWDELKAKYSQKEFEYHVRGKKIVQDLQFESLTGLTLERVCFPEYEDVREKVKFMALEGVPGVFPFTGGVFPLKRRSEEPTRLVVGEGGAERSNARLHYLQRGMKGHRLSSVFDSVTLYGANPSHRPDIYGKIGNSGGSIFTLDEMKKLYSGFNLCDPHTSLNMTINGPSPIVLAFYMNTCIDQQVEYRLRKDGKWDEVEKELNCRLPDRPKYIPYRGKLPEGHDGTGLGLLGTNAKEMVEMGFISESVFEEIRKFAFRNCRGTVQADVLKEDQAQNSCIFSLGFALKMVADVQLFFTENEIKNFYSISVSGYHIAEAGANPVTQMAFTLANGFTFLEYFKSRGLDVNQFAHNLSFFFSCGMDPEYAVLGRVCRRIWAIALRDVFSASERCQKLKYHIQTSGRSLQAQDCNFNDPRTTLQALMAIEDHCNSLHTNAYDEAFTTPTEESVRRAIAIQLIINRELGIGKFENIPQGSFVYDTLTSKVEQEVLREFDRLNERGGVVGAMEYSYQRSKIQEESHIYENAKFDGSLPIIGFNEYVSADSESSRPSELSRTTDTEKDAIISNLELFEKRHKEKSADALRQLKAVCVSRGNVFEELLETVQCCSLGQITESLYEVGGSYRCST